ncbi:MAG: histidine phosphotransferase family protein [Caulobacteraceae bacterium]
MCGPSWTGRWRRLPCRRRRRRWLVNLAQLAANALPLGGIARLEVTHGAEGHVVSAVARGPKARLAAEVRTGLAGGPLGDGLGGRWVQAYYIHVLTAAAGGTIEADTGEELVTFRAIIPG